MKFTRTGQNMTIPTGAPNYRGYGMPVEREEPYNLLTFNPMKSSDLSSYLSVDTLK
ncbi:MAG: hypothetical protein HKL82_04730 [Acidimicrobiaceae bacterium]|nr:hypothetical protein [Acidimicrobiaceae bacterium]